MNKTLILLLISIAVSGQSIFRLEGKVNNASEDQLQITLYRNWVQPPEDYILKLDSLGTFHFNTMLSETAYMDLNYGLNGLLFQIIEPGDKLFLKADELSFYESLSISGDGSEKWIYYAEQRDFVSDNQLSRFYELLKTDPDIYLDSVSIQEKREIDLLQRHKEKVGESFFLLRRADIIGKMNSLRLDYYLATKNTENVFGFFHKDLVSSSLQNRSFEYGSFVERLLNAFNSTRSRNNRYSLTDEYNFIIYCFEKGWIGKSIAERLAAGQISNYLELEGFSSENESIIRDFLNFSTNQSYTTYLEGKIQNLKAREIGSKAPAFELTDVENRRLTLKSLKGKSVLMVFWASWCEPCKEDLKYLPIIKNYFKSASRLEIVNFAVDTPEDFANVVSLSLAAGKAVRINPGSSFLKEYGVYNIPGYIFLDKNGNWVNIEPISPSIDEGRALIKQLEQYLK
ncbi:MAG: redoxin domain-containing protein [Cytophagales bacterium]|nr:redoxin domain-containing protein [Cytophagales bacterium]